jgi:hypothetical protein
MKTESRVNSQLLLILLVLVFIFLSYLTVISQTQADSKYERIPPPSEEKFETAVGTVAPWREVRCWYANPSEKDAAGNPCPAESKTVTKDDWDKREIATLFNEEGSIWFRFNLSAHKPDSLKNRLNKDFVPFAGNTEKNYQNIVLRMVGESKHWLEVEINEKTRETKFVLKRDPTWSKASWDFWLAYDISLMVDSNRTPLFDKPDGKILEESSLDSIWKVLFIKTEGDWAYVKAWINQREFNAWVRWRKGRDILVGTVFTYHKIPDVKLDAKDN